MRQFSKPSVDTLRESTMLEIALYDSQEDHVDMVARTALRHSGGGSLSKTATKDFRKTDIESAAITQRKDFFELPP